jgi:virulence-associated protein VagC
MGVIEPVGSVETKVFKAGNSAAVRLPASLAFPVGTAVRIERVGDSLTIKPVIDKEEEKRKIREFLDRLDEIWKDAPDDPDRGVRHPVEFPDRPGLY